MRLDNSTIGVKIKKNGVITEVPGVRVKKDGTITTVWEKIKICTVSKYLANTETWACSCGGTVTHYHYRGGHSACGNTETLDYKVSICDTCGVKDTEGTDWTAYTHEY